MNSSFSRLAWKLPGPFLADLGSFYRGPLGELPRESAGVAESLSGLPGRAAGLRLGGADLLPQGAWEVEVGVLEKTAIRWGWLFRGGGNLEGVAIWMWALDGVSKRGWGWGVV